MPFFSAKNMGYLRFCALKRGGAARLMYNHKIFERFWGCLGNGNLDNIHTSTACSSTDNL